MRTLWLAVALLLTACQPEVSSAKKAVSSVLKDPSSAQWKDVHSIAPGVACGRVNAKNSYGGYTGFRQFLLRDGRLYFSEDELESIKISTCCTRLSSPKKEVAGVGVTASEISEACDALPWIPVILD